MFQDIGESAFRKRTVKGSHGLENFIAGSFLKRDVTSFLAEFHKTREAVVHELLVANGLKRAT